MRPNIGMVEYGDHSQVYSKRKLNNKKFKKKVTFNIISFRRCHHGNYILTGFHIVWIIVVQLYYYCLLTGRDKTGLL